MTFQSSSYQNSGFQVDLEGGPQGGGWEGPSDYERLFLTVGRRKVLPDDEQAVVEAVAEKIAPKGEVEWVDDAPTFVAPVNIDLIAVERLRRQAHKLAQEIVLKAIARILKAAQEADDHEVELLLLN